MDEVAVGTPWGWCCVDDDVGAPVCRHARELVAALAGRDLEEANRVLVEDRRRVERAGGVQGLLEAAGQGDEGALHLLESAGCFAEDVPDDVPEDVPEQVRPEESAGSANGEESVDGEESAKVDGLSSWQAESGWVLGAAAGQLGIEVGHLVAMPGGPRLAAALAGLEVRGMERVALVEVAAAARRLESWAARMVVAAAGELSRQSWLFDHPDERRGAVRLDPTSEEVAMRLTVTRREAQDLVRVGRGLLGTFSDTSAALERGEIDARKAATIVTMLDGASTAVAWMVEQDVLPVAGRCTNPQLRERLQRRLAEVDPEEAAARHQRARAGRHVTRTRTLADGMGSITAVLPAQDAVLIDQTLSAVATAARAGGDPRTTDQLRADVLVAAAGAAILTGRTGPHADPDTIAELQDLGPEPCQGPACRPDLATDPPAPSTRDHRSPSEAPADSGPPIPDMSDPVPPDADPADPAAPDVAPTAPAAPEPDPPDADSPDAGPPDGGPADPAAPVSDRAGADPSEPGPPDTGPPEARPPVTPGDSSTDSAARVVQGAFPDLGPGIPEVAVISPLLAALLRRGCESLRVVRPQVRVTVPVDLLLSAQAQAQSTALPGSEGTAAPGSEGTPAPGSVGTAAPGSEGTAAPGSEGTALRGAEATDTTDTPFDDVGQPAAVLSGYGAITTGQALALAARCSTLQRLVSDPLTGAVLDVGRTRYRPPAALAEHVRVRDATCTRPGCATPAERCELDHTVPWSAGGVTAVGNLGAECTRDHLLKTAGAFHVSQPAPGVFVWTTPTGHTYRRDPDGLLTLLRTGRATQRAQDTQETQGTRPERHSAEYDEPPPF